MSRLVVFTIFILLNEIHARSMKIRSEVKENFKNPTANETGLKIDLQFDESDYEMLQENDIKDFQIKDPDFRFQTFDKIAKEEYEKGNYNRRYELKNENKTTPEQKEKTKIMIVEKSTMSPVKNHSIEKRSIAIQINYDFIFGKRFKIPKTNRTKTKIDKVDPFRTKIMEMFKEISCLKTSYNCTEEDLTGIGIKAIKCTISQFGNADKSNTDLAMNLIQIATVWLFVYLLFAVPLWCTKGWCSCCLCCKFFKPQQTIQEAKNYLLLNPPGTLVTKKGGIIHYEPTEREKDCYEEFGHFIRTL